MWNLLAMAMPGSPSSFTNGYEEDPIFQKSHYTQDISEQMRVPKRIKATGEYYDDFDMAMSNGTSNWGYQDKIDMTVPDRIMVIGQDQHIGKFCPVLLINIPIAAMAFHVTCYFFDCRYTHRTT